MTSIVLLVVLVVVLLANGVFSYRALPVSRRPLSLRFMSSGTDASAPKAKAVDQKVLSKSDVVSILQERTQFHKDDIVKVVNTFVDVIRDEVFLEGNEIRMRDFGTFKILNRSPRNARNPKTGEMIKVSGKRSLGFSAAGCFREDV